MHLYRPDYFSCFRGTYELQPKAFHGKAEPILGPKIQVQLQPNLMKPTSLSVEYDKKAAFKVGDKLPGWHFKTGLQYFWVSLTSFFLVG